MLNHNEVKYQGFPPPIIFSTKSRWSSGTLPFFQVRWRSHANRITLGVDLLEGSYFDTNFWNLVGRTTQ